MKMFYSIAEESASDDEEEEEDADKPDSGESVKDKANHDKDNRVNTNTEHKTAYGDTSDNT